jgi:hypothetical protein
MLKNRNTIEVRLSVTIKEISLATVYMVNKLQKYTKQTGLYNLD